MTPIAAIGLGSAIVDKLFAQGDQLYALIRDDEIAQHFLDVAELHQPGLEFTLNGPRRRPDGEGLQGGVFVFGERLQVGQHRHSSDVLIKGMRANLFQPLHHERHASGHGATDFANAAVVGLSCRRTQPAGQISGGFDFGV
jgi:hypothetical protein